MRKEIKQSWRFKQSPEEVWEYLTKPELIGQWLMKNDFQPIVGHKFRFTFVPKLDSKYKGAVDCEVLEVRPFSKLSYSWKGAANDGSRTFNSIVVWTLLPNDSGTELQLLHDGFEILEDILAHTEGWKSCLKKLEDSINVMKP